MTIPPERDDRKGPLNSVVALTKDEGGAVEGQMVPGYREEEGVEASRDTETFVSIRAHVDNWRWSGVPFFLRTGKRMWERRTEIVIQFKRVPHNLFRAGAGPQVGNRLVIRVQPDEGIELHMLTKIPGPGGMKHQRAPLNLSFAATFGDDLPDAYERLLMDLVRGKSALFMRRDEVEAAWAPLCAQADSIKAQAAALADEMVRAFWAACRDASNYHAHPALVEALSAPLCEYFRSGVGGGAQQSDAFRPSSGAVEKLWLHGRAGVGKSSFVAALGLALQVVLRAHVRPRATRQSSGDSAARLVRDEPWTRPEQDWSSTSGSAAGGHRRCTKSRQYSTRLRQAARGTGRGKCVRWINGLCASYLSGLGTHAESTTSSSRYTLKGRFSIGSTLSGEWSH